MNKIILLLCLGLICLMGIASVSAIDLDDRTANDSAVNVSDFDDCVICVSDSDAYEYAEGSHVEQQILDVDSNINNDDCIRIPQTNKSINPVFTDNSIDSHENCTDINYNVDSDDSSPFHILASNFEIQKKIDGKKMDVKLIGRFDVDSATHIEESLTNDLNDIKELTFDLKDMTYISTSVLRVFDSMNKFMNEHNGSMKLINVPDNIRFVLDVTGYSEIFTIE